MAEAVAEEAIGEALYALVVIAVRHHVRDISLTSAATLSRLERTGGRRITELAASEGITQPSMTVLVTGLERAGFVERQKDDGDRRAVRVALTPAGAAYLRERRRDGAEIFSRLIGKLAEEDVRALCAAAPALRRLLELDSEARDAVRGESGR